ncbi:JAB domain-containing protein [Candidatus Propionivibrio aalborgensis]|nr:DNA repair protein RadC [Candidatus Propionivibrio aalborgensis]
MPAIDSACCFLLNKQERRIVKRAFKVLEKSAVYRSKAMSTPHAVRDYLKLRLVSLEHEEFHVLWLDAQNRVIAFDALFTGTITQTAIYPREVVKAGLAHNAAAVVLAHNHPSGIPEPSAADRLLTQELKSALALVDIRVLDHFIVAGDLSTSFAERGLL